MKPSISGTMDPDKHDKTALLIIDVQQGLFEQANPIHRAGELLQNINTLIERARAAGVPVIFIQHSNDEGMVRGSAGWQLHPELKPLPGEALIHKRFGNAFEDTNLAQVLQQDQVSGVVIAGLVTHGCVKASCLGALELGYRVTLAGDAHSNYSKQAAELIAGLNQKMAAKNVMVKPTAEIAFG